MKGGRLHLVSGGVKLAFFGGQLSGGLARSMVGGTRQCRLFGKGGGWEKKKLGKDPESAR